MTLDNLNPVQHQQETTSYKLKIFDKCDSVSSLKASRYKMKAFKIDKLDPLTKITTPLVQNGKIEKMKPN